MSCHIVVLVYRSESIIKVVLMTIYNYCWFEIVQYNLFFHLKTNTNHSFVSGSSCTDTDLGKGNWR